MRDAIERIRSYCGSLKSVSDFVSEQKTFDACIRNFQILGDAAGKVPVSIQKELKGIPWREIKSMRNLLVHEYFGISSSIVWNTIQEDLPRMKEFLDIATRYYDHPIHPWRICPPGEIYVRQATISEHIRSGAIVREHLRRDHCRQSHGSGKNILTPQETRDMAELFFKNLSGGPAAHDLGAGPKGLEFDVLIRGWTQYWNEVFKPEPRLDPNIVKALIFSESSFERFAGKGKRGKAKGLMQLMPLTIRALNGARNELTDQLFEFQDSEVYDTSLNISAGIRWLFHKRETASRRLKRQATWEEAVEEYKDYLRRRLRNPRAKQDGMRIFREKLFELENSGKDSREE